MQVISSLAVVVGMAAVGGILAKILRQPAILGYLVAGIILAAWGRNLEFVSAMGQLGVTLLLFLVGLELPLAHLKKIGRVAVITGLGQMIISGILGFVLARILGLPIIASLFLGVVLTFSSTVLIVRLLSEKKDLQSLYGKIVTGYLLVQDFVAIGVLVALSGVGGGGLNWQGVGLILIKGVFLIGGAVWLSEKVLPSMLVWLGRSSEILFITSLGWCLVIAAIVSSKFVGFGPEIGGFLAGLALANAAQNLQIVARVRPLRDFFLTLFFVGLGATFSFNHLSQLWFSTLVLSVFVLIINPLIVLIILGWQGYSKRVSFLAGSAVGQISEFSLIVMTIANRVGYVSQDVLALTGLVGIITMVLSTYLISNSEKVYKKIGKWLVIFERKQKKLSTEIENKLSGHVVLFGHNRAGKIIRPVLEALGEKVLVVDFNPQIVEEIGAIYGDIADYELYDELNLEQAKMVISTVPDIEDNLQLLRAVKQPITIILAVDTADALKLYADGADYVLVPHTVGADYLSHLLSTHGLDRKFIHQQGKDQKERLLSI